jgi:hypothetical protein
MFEGGPKAEAHTFALPNGEKMAVTGTHTGTLERPTITGVDSEGNDVQAVFEKIDGELVLVSLSINGEAQSIDAEPEKMAA